MALEPKQRAVLEAAMNRLIPADDYPSATGAGVMNYLEALGGDHGEPWWPLLITGLADLDSEAEGRWGARFAALGPDQQDELLAAVEHGTVATTWHADPAHFFELLLTTAVEGFYSDPGNGGNRGGVAWSMVGYPVPLVPAGPGRLPGVTRSREQIRDSYDAVVVGSGAGGGAAAYVLARAGLEVLVVERGDALGAGPGYGAPKHGA